MITRTNRAALLAAIFLVVAGCATSSVPAALAVPAASPVPATLADDAWPVFGRTTDETHYSPLAQIDRETVSRLGVAWYADLDTPWSATAPVAAEGVLYVAAGLSVVHAFDIETGSLLWRHDPQVHLSGEVGRLRGTGWGIRGLAYSAGRVFVGLKDGRLLALDAISGEPVWSAQTLDEPGMDSAAISGPPRVFDGKVIMGFGGADLGTTRAYVTAYDEATGERLWRFWTVPGNPADGFENPAMALAAETWTGEWWRFGGGGTVWNAMTYDREFDRVYLGTGNGGPWNRKIRSPDGGDNLFLSSIVALDADTGEYIWHYQTVPGETWDYNSSMDMQLAELEIDGERIPVLYHAPKNGFFYVIDRRDGSLVSGDAWTKVTWALGIDPETGRPIEAENARYEDGPRTFYPSPTGAHNWQPMSTSARTGLVYIPETVLYATFADADNLADYEPRPGTHSATGVAFVQGDEDPATMEIGGGLVAWDPAAREIRWRIAMPFYWNSGALSTAGGLLFHGQADGSLFAYADDTGEPFWNFDTHGPLTAPVITYSHDGIQYVTLVTGMAGGATTSGPASAVAGWDFRTFPRRVITFALDGRVQLPERVPPTRLVAARDPGYQPDAALAAVGESVYFDVSCVSCHGPGAIAGGGGPDLRASPVSIDANALRAVVLGGALAHRGMPQYEQLSAEEFLGLHQYLRARAADLRAEQGAQ